MAKGNKDLTNVTVFGTTLCGALIGSIVSGLLIFKLDLSPSGGGPYHMSFEGLAAVMLAAAAIVVGIVLPLAGIFAFGFLRSDVRNKAEEFMSNEIKDGKFHRQVEDAINSALKDEDGVLKQYVDSSVKRAFEAHVASSQIATANKRITREGKIEWGYEADEYGDEPRTKGRE